MIRGAEISREYTAEFSSRQARGLKIKVVKFKGDDLKLSGDEFAIADNLGLAKNFTIFQNFSTT